MFLVAAFFVLGAVLGGQINNAIYRFAYFSNPPISPWMKPHPKAAKRSAIDFVPVIGWCFLIREEKIHGGLFWLRPFLIELGAGFAAAGLYLFHIEQPGLIPESIDVPLATRWSWLIAHLVLFTFLTIATFIDLDEFIIPDQTTIPGVVFFICFAAGFPAVLLPNLIGENQYFEPMSFAAPLDPPTYWYGNVGWLACVGCLWFWCFALMPKICTFRKGLGRFFPLMLASILQRPRKRTGTIPIAPRKVYWGTPVLAVIGVLGTAMIPVYWFLMAADHQKMGLMTAFFGMTFGMCMIWSIRITGRLALGKEAMGFGDVTLMAMIGAYVGWQACLPILVISALVALAISIPVALLKSETTLPYGPYLSIATVFVVLFWNSIWENWLKRLFEDLSPQFIFAVLVIMTIPMFVLLLITRFVKERLIGIR